MGIRSNKHASRGRAAVRNGDCFLKNRDCIPGLIVGDQRESKVQKGTCVVRLHREYAAQFAYRLIVAMRLKQNPRYAGAGNRKGIEFPATLCPGHSLVRTSLAQQPQSKPGMSIGVVGVQFEGASVFCLGVGPVKLFLLHVCEEDMRVGKVRLELKRFSGCADYFRAHFFRRSSDKNRAEVAESTCQADVSRRKRRVDLDCAVKITDALLNARPAVAFVISKPAFQVALINFRRDGTRCYKPL